MEGRPPTPDDAGDLCQICLCDLAVDVCALDCGHRYHTGCVSRHVLEWDDRCPECRREVSARGGPDHHYLRPEFRRPDRGDSPDPGRDVWEDRLYEDAKPRMMGVLVTDLEIRQFLMFCYTPTGAIALGHMGRLRDYLLLRWRGPLDELIGIIQARRRFLGLRPLAV